MKKGVLMAGVAALAIVLSACGNGGTKEASSDNNSKKEEIQEEEKPLSGNEIAAIYAIQQLKKGLKNPHSLNIFEIKYLCISIDESLSEYEIQIEYSAENNVGGTIENTKYYTFKADVYTSNKDNTELIKIKNEDCGFNKLPIMESHLKKNFAEKGITVDIDRVLNNIDVDITELKQIQE